MDQALERARKEYWGGRDLPFLVALDGGGKVQIEGTNRTARGRTTARYGITGFPTMILIDKKGNVITTLDLNHPSAETEIRSALGL